MKRIKAAAIEAGQATYFTGAPCKRGHVAPRDTAKGVCVECDRERRERDRNTGKLAAQRRALYHADPERHLAASKRWRDAHRDFLRQSKKEQYERNREQRAVQRKARYYADPEGAIKKTLEWQMKNPGRLAAKLSRHRAERARCMPSWVSLKEIRAIYNEAKRISASTGIEHEVDHIIPLKHKLVCGLHVPWNLQIITKDENRRKGNRVDLDGLCACSSAGSAAKDKLLRGR